MQISQAEHDRFREQGYLIFDPEFPDGLVDSAVAELEPLWDRGDDKPDDAWAPRIRNSWQRCPSLRRITAWPRTRELLAELYGGLEAYAWHTLSFYVGTEQSIHSDAIHFDTLPQGYICGVWVALEDMDEDNGPLLYCPGTHTWKQYRMEDVGVPSARPWYKDHEAFMRRKIAAADPKTEPALIRKGQAVMWHGNLLHGGAPRRDRARTRLSHVIHYAFHGTRVYTPLRSRGRRRFVRNPRPILDPETPADRLRWMARFLDPWFAWHAVTHNAPHLAKTHIMKWE